MANAHSCQTIVHYNNAKSASLRLPFDCDIYLSNYVDYYVCAWLKKQEKMAASEEESRHTKVNGSAGSRTASGTKLMSEPGERKRERERERGHKIMQTCIF